MADDPARTPRVIQEILDANKVYNFPQLPTDAGHALTPGSSAAAALQKAVQDLVAVAPGAPANIGSAITALTGLLGPLVAAAAMCCPTLSTSPSIRTAFPGPSSTLVVASDNSDSGMISR
jgi:hypothetical protein